MRFRCAAGSARGERLTWPAVFITPVRIYRRTGNLRAVQLLLGYSKIESTVRYLGIEVDDAIEIAEKIDI
jgi:hypothetical protein